MSLQIKDLKESNVFLNLLFENITSAVFLIDKNFNVQKVNKSFEILFSNKEEDIIDQLCGKVLGCHYTIDSGKACGTTPNCEFCELRNSSNAVFDYEKDTYKQLMFREFYINNSRLPKYFQYSSKQLSYNNHNFVIMIVDDVTENENKKNEISQKNKEITDSLNYAKNIQSITLPNNEFFKHVFPKHFVLFKPKDIVSGDFYWISEHKNLKYIVVADCTGHGVPGALMSIMGINFLNDIFNNLKIFEVYEILNLLRTKVISALKQRGVSGEQKDGMDMAICSINSETLEMQFAGANSSIYYISKNNKELVVELKGDKMPIAIHEQMHSFTCKTLHLTKGDSIYLMTDGYQDQFGGPTSHKGGKKFLMKNLKQLFIKNCHKNMDIQKEELNNALEKWKNGYEKKHEQTDDITIIGIEF